MKDELAKFLTGWKSWNDFHSSLHIGALEKTGLEDISSSELQCSVRFMTFLV